MKSAKICPLTDVLGMYCMSYSPSSILHSAAFLRALVLTGAGNKVHWFNNQLLPLWTSHYPSVFNSYPQECALLYFEGRPHILLSFCQFAFGMLCLPDAVIMKSLVKKSKKDAILILKMKTFEESNKTSTIRRIQQGRYFVSAPARHKNAFLSIPYPAKIWTTIPTTVWEEYIRLRKKKLKASKVYNWETASKILKATPPMNLRTLLKSNDFKNRQKSTPCLTSARHSNAPSTLFLLKHSKWRTIRSKQSGKFPLIIKSLVKKKQKGAILELKRRHLKKVPKQQQYAVSNKEDTAYLRQLITRTRSYQFPIRRKIKPITVVSTYLDTAYPEIFRHYKYWTQKRSSVCKNILFTYYTSEDEFPRPRRAAKVWKLVQYGVSKELDTAYWAFLGVGTTFDIFQNIIFLFLNTMYRIFWIRLIDFIPFVIFGGCRHGYAVSS
ncbi:hypothetical protein Tco_1094571 [Tanacetum coccineum]|uniref:Uncharacterized protein n=1 Tax=Tanacetum coccineum TaxID=301880 RepID=A0ABQ5IIA3_9ASTR